MLKNGPFWRLLRILLLVILLCLNLDDVDGGLPRMGPRFSRPISSPTISKYPRRRQVVPRPKLPTEPTGFKSLADHLSPIQNNEALAEFKKFIDRPKFDGLPKGKENNHFGNFHHGPNLPSTSAASGFTNNGFNKPLRNSIPHVNDPNLPSTSAASGYIYKDPPKFDYEAHRFKPPPKKFNRSPPAAEREMQNVQSEYPELFGGSHRDAAPVRVMDTNRNNRFGESGPVSRRNSIDSNNDYEQMPSTSNSLTNQQSENHPTGLLGQYWQSTGLNDKEKNYKTGKSDIGELAFSLIPQNDMHFASMIYGGSQLADVLGEKHEDIAEFMTKRVAVRYGVKGIKEGVTAVLPAENAEAIMGNVGPFLGAASAPLIARSVTRGFHGYEKYKQEEQLPWQRNKLRPGQYWDNYKRKTLKSARDPKNFYPYLVRCVVVGGGCWVGTMAGGAVGGVLSGPAFPAGATAGGVTGGIIGSKLAERFVSAPLEQFTRNKVKARQEKRRKKEEIKKYGFAPLAKLEDYDL